MPTKQKRNRFQKYDARAHTLSQWRGVREKEAVDYSRIKTSSDIISKLINKLNLQTNYDSDKIEEHWKLIVGDFLAKFSKPIKVTNSILYVQITNSTVKYEFESQLKKDCLQKLNSSLDFKLQGKIVDIKFIL